jgi:tetratricopeptide (TPR) repeat protein
MLSKYETALANGDQTAAVKYVLDYTEKANGVNAPKTVRLTHRYGSLLYKDGDYQKATEVLIKALERSTAAYGESGGEAFEINMNIAYASSRWQKGLSRRTKYFDREQERLMTAIDELSRDTDTNRIFLEAANSVLMEIAWLDEDEDRLMAMCTAGMVNSASEYPPDRLYEIMEGGMVFAPELGVRVSTNIFRASRSRGERPKDENGNPVKRPFFKPVCIDGRLMAALIHAPRVTIEEVR